MLLTKVFRVLSDYGRMLLRSFDVFGTLRLAIWNDLYSVGQFQ